MTHVINKNMKLMLLCVFIVAISLLTVSCDGDDAYVDNALESETESSAVSEYEVERESETKTETETETEVETETELESETEKSNTDNGEKGVYHKLVISDFDTVDGWGGMFANGKNVKPAQGNGYVEASNNGDVVIDRLFSSPIDMSNYAICGKLHISVYVDSPEFVTGGQIEFSSGGGADRYELRFGEFNRDIKLSAGWNDIVIDFSEAHADKQWATQKGYPDFRSFTYCRIYFNIVGGQTVCGLDDFYIFTENESDIEFNKQSISSFDSLDEKWSSNGTLTLQSTDDSPTGTPYMLVETYGDAVLSKSFRKNPFDISKYAETGYLHLWLYVEKASLISGGQIELTSSGGADSQEYNFGQLKQDIELVDGWNELILPLSSMKEQNGAADLEDINYIRVYLNSSANIKMGIDDFYVYAVTGQSIPIITLSLGDQQSSMNVRPNDGVSLAELGENLGEEGFDIVGWSDGETDYGVNDNYIMGESDVTLNAIVKNWDHFAITYFDGEGNSADGEKTYENGTVKLSVSPFEKEGYTFAGWKDASGKTYKAGHSYTINSKDNTLTAVWEKIDDFALLSGAQEAWELREGGPVAIAPSAIGRADAELKWTVWLNSDTFGQTIDFSTEGSVMSASDTAVNLSGDFAISVWIKAPIRKNGVRTVLSGGSEWCLELDKNGELSFKADGVSGLESSGTYLIDGRWHHVLVTRAGDEITYYIDGDAIKVLTVSGAVKSSNNVYAGADKSGKNGFDGSMAQIRIYGEAKTPSQVTEITVIESDNVRNKPVFDTYHGITTDRSQGFGTKGGTFTSDDIQACKDMGFEYVRMMIYVDNLVGKNGKLNEEYINWSKDFINGILDNGLRCMISLGCGDRGTWNGKYLGTENGFEELVIFFGELTEWINEQGWNENEVCLLTFTEPVNASGGKMDWTWMSDRICAAIRNVDPNLTIVTSSDSYGYIENMKSMVPVTDENVIYSFTSYEPYTVGFNTFNGGSKGSWWSYVKDIPYPIEEGVDYTDAVAEAISEVPEDMKQYAKKWLDDYVAGISDGAKPNVYGILYNEDWHMARAKSLDDWSNKYGGGIVMFVAEFGGCDRYSNTELLNMGMPGSGISEKTRLKLIADTVKAYDAYGITWSFWEYNESFTVFNPKYRKHFEIVTRDMYDTYMYKELLDSLGLDYNKDLIK